MDPYIVLLAGVAGGFVNVIAGGAKVFVFPLLLAAGLPPLTANATATVGLWPAQLPGVRGYWSILRALGIAVDLMIAATGAVLGALLLPFLGEEAFVAVAPWFLYAALFVIMFHGRLVPRAVEPSEGRSFQARGLIFAAAAYGGYFGAGYSYLILASVMLSGVQDMHLANARKNLIATTANMAAVVPLAIMGLVRWDAAALVLLGGLIGGELGRRSISRLPGTGLRWLIVLLGIGLATYSRLLA